MQLISVQWRPNNQRQFYRLRKFICSGSGYFSSGITVTGEVSGQTITAQSGNFDTIITAPTITGGTISGDNVYVSGIVISGGEITITGDLFVSNTITGYRISGEFIDAVQEITAASGAFASTVTGLTIIGNTLQGLSTISGATVTGTTAQFTTGTFQDLFVDDNFIIGNNLTVSGDLNVSGEVYLQSGLTSRDQAFFPSGDQVNPGIVFIDDANTGFI